MRDRLASGKKGIQINFSAVQNGKRDEFIFEQSVSALHAVQRQISLELHVPNWLQLLAQVSAVPVAAQDVRGTPTSDARADWMGVL
jgi:hypothetical protein